MALTDRETVFKVLQSGGVTNPERLNEELQLNVYDWEQLEQSNVTEGSECVKIIRVNTPQADSHNAITLNDQVGVDLDAQKIVRDSVVIASDLVLTTVYTENSDYIIDYENGVVARTTSGSTIANGGQVFVWYIPFVVLSEGDDYSIDYESGLVRRRIGGSIPNEATVYVDYNHTEISASSALIGELIEEMEAFVEPRLKSSYSLESTDKGLKAASTNYVLYSYCLAAGMKELTTARRDQSDDLAKQWGMLGDKYLANAEKMFAKYLSVTTQQVGGLIQNRYVASRRRQAISPSVTNRTRSH